MVRAPLNYLLPGGPPNRRFVAPGAEINTGSYEPVMVGIADARPLASTLASHGFALLRHASAVADFGDADEVDRLYPTEIDALVRAATGAALTIPFGWMLRTSAAIDGGRQPPAADVHVDLTPDRAERVARAFLEREGLGDRTPSRFLITSLWRAFSPPPQDCPLALCAGFSVRDDEGVPNVMITVDALPDAATAIAPIADESRYPAASVFAWNPAHRWYYFPDMTDDEAVLITFYDSARGANWRVPHTAFTDPGADATCPRESIEFRSIAYWFDEDAD
jgi:hypothetical protein